MRAVVQRVNSAHVSVDSDTVGRIELGILAYVGVGHDDNEEHARALAEKLLGLRIFPDASGKMTQSVVDMDGSILVVSQFTLFGDVRKGRRPSFTAAAEPDQARHLIEVVCAHLRAAGQRVETGRFGADMRVHAEVWGPVTILCDTHKLF